MKIDTSIIYIILDLNKYNKNDMLLRVHWQ